MFRLALIRAVRKLPFGPHGPVPRAEVLGHKMEVQWGKHRFLPRPPPRVPLHPIKDAGDINMNELTTYKDLKFRWKRTLKPRNMRIKRKWKTVPAWGPRPVPSATLIVHDRLAVNNKPLLLTNALAKDLAKEKLNTELFAVVKTSHRLQHKVVAGDIVQTERLHRVRVGQQICLGTVLLVGSKRFTLIGQPTVGNAKVWATVEQQTLSRENISFYYKPRRRMSRFMRVRHWVTMLRIDRIELCPEIATDQNEKEIKPKRLLELWANRWLTIKEQAALESNTSSQRGKKKETPLYDGSEHQPGTHQRRGLVAAFRFTPDPLAPLVKHF